MGFHSWLCAKSKVSIPSPSAAENRARDCKVHLYTSNGIRVSGYSNGAGDLVVEKADLMPNAVARASHLHRIPRVFNVEEFVGKHEGSSTDVAGQLVKIVRNVEFAPEDTWKDLDFSLPCPYQGHFYDPQATADHLYNGNYFEAWKSEFGSPNIDNGQRANNLKEAVLSFLEDTLSPEEAREVVTGETSITDMRAAVASHQQPAAPSMLMGDRAAEYGLLMLLDDPHFAERVDQLSTATYSPSL